MVDTLFWVGALWMFAGVVLSFSARGMLAATCEAFGLTILGTSCFLRSLNSPDVILGFTAYVLALATVIGAAIVERREKKYAGKEVHERQVDGQGTEGPGDRAH